MLLSKLKIYNNRIVLDVFKEEEHPRGGPDNPGQFVKKGEGSSGKKTEGKIHKKSKEVENLSQEKIIDFNSRNLFTEKQEKQFFKEVNKWGKDRKFYANKALKEISNENAKGKIFFGENKDIKAIIAFNEKDYYKNKIFIVALATKEKGYGKNLIYEVSKEAEKKNKGIILQSDPDSINFYKKIGMIEDISNDLHYFNFSPKQVKDFVRNNKEVIKPWPTYFQDNFLYTEQKTLELAKQFVDKRDIWKKH